MSELVERQETLTLEHRELIKELGVENRRLETLMLENREPIDKLVHDNRHLKSLIKTLRYRIQDLEKSNMVIDREIAEIPIDFDLIPESDLNKH